jgi:acetyltransferase-like isoleucine patch superfamily enzyme
MADESKARKRIEAPYTRIEPFHKRIKRAAEEHGYYGWYKVVVFPFRMLANFYLNLLSILVPYSGIRVVLHRLRGVKIGKNVLIGFNVTIDNIFPHLVSIGDGSSLAGNNLILAHSKPLEYHKSIFESYTAPVVVGKNVWITVGVIVVAGVTIGDGSVITAGSVVTKDIPPHSLASGNPAQVIKKLDIDEDGE